MFVERPGALGYAAPTNPELVSKTLLGSTATYRVLEELPGDLVLVEVVTAPGLRAGERIKFTRSAIEEMRA